MWERSGRLPAVRAGSAAGRTLRRLGRTSSKWHFLDDAVDRARCSVGEIAGHVELLVFADAKRGDELVGVGQFRVLLRIEVERPDASGVEVAVDVLPGQRERGTAVHVSAGNGLADG